MRRCTVARRRIRRRGISPSAATMARSERRRSGCPRRALMLRNERRVGSRPGSARANHAMSAMPSNLRADSCSAEDARSPAPASSSGVARLAPAMVVLDLRLVLVAVSADRCDIAPEEGRNNASNSSIRSGAMPSAAREARRMSSIERGPSRRTASRNVIVCSGASAKPARRSRRQKAASGAAPRGSALTAPSPGLWAVPEPDRRGPLVLDQNADRPPERFRPGAATLFENRRGIGPFDRFRNAGRLGQRAGADVVDRARHRRCRRSATSAARAMMISASRRRPDRRSSGRRNAGAAPRQARACGSTSARSVSPSRQRSRARDGDLKSDRNSSSSASNSWSERSISSMSSRLSVGVRSTCSSGRANQEAVVVDLDFAVAGLADRQQLALIIPLVECVLGVDAS